MNMGMTCLPPNIRQVGFDTVMKHLPMPYMRVRLQALPKARAWLAALALPAALGLPLHSALAAAPGSPASPAPLASAASTASAVQPAAQGAKAAVPVQVQDDLGHSLSFRTPPQRIVSLLPSLTESVCALGACARMVGVDRYSNWPIELKTLPQVGGGIDPNIEAIVRLKPDLVLSSNSARGLERLRALGIPVLVLEPKGGLHDMQRVLRILAQVLGLPATQADTVWVKARADVRAAASQLPANARGMTVFFQASMGPFGAGPNSFMGEVLSELGLKNVLPADLGPFPKLNPEYVVRAKPQWVMSSEYADLPEAGLPTKVNFRYPGWNDMDAVRSGRVCLFSRAQADVLVRPGPRLGEAASIVASCVKRQMADSAATAGASAKAP